MHQRNRIIGHVYALMGMHPAGEKAFFSKGKDKVTRIVARQLTPGLSVP